LIDKRPALIARCAGVGDVIDSVNFARENDLLVPVRAGGLVIDFSPMKGMGVDPERRTVRAEGEATWADLDRETQVFGLATPGGEVSEERMTGRRFLDMEELRELRSEEHKEEGGGAHGAMKCGALLEEITETSGLDLP
jgi:hypothetical protein